MTPERTVSDAGVTLVELIVYVAVAAIVLGGVVAVFVGALRAQSEAVDRDVASGRAALAADSLTQSMRNAAAVRVDDGRVLRARVAVGATGWECRGWALEPDGLRYRVSSGPLDLAERSGWDLLVPGASATDGAGGFTARAGTVEIALIVRAGNADTPIETVLTPGARGSGEGCW